MGIRNVIAKQSAQQKCVVVEMLAFYVENDTLSCCK